MINDLIQFCYEQGWSKAIYTGGAIVTVVFQFFFHLFYRKKYDISLRKVVILFSIAMPLHHFSMYFLAWVENGFQDWGANNIIRTFVYFPLFLLLAAKIAKVPVNKVIDFAAPGMALNQAIGHSVCPFAGCCQGYACSWGIWNPITETYLFPNQWLECVVAAIVAWYLLHLAKKEKYVGTGRVYAMFLITFGGTRFLLEFLRDNDKLFFGVSNLALHALFMVFVGAVWLMVLYEKEKQKEKKMKNHH